ncbi:MAG: alanine racemase [Crocinitomicaceae bacterium]|jgi:alanine racemase
MARATRAIINLHALRENYQFAQKQAPHSRAYAVVKANAYGHGVMPVVNALANEADGFAVACVDEAIIIRRGGVLLPILVLEGPMDGAECQLAVDYNLELALHNQQQIEWLKALSKGQLKVWVKVESGMHRLGFRPQHVPALVSELRALPAVGEIQLMSHFACADDPANPFNQQQLAVLTALKPMNLNWSMSNSAAILTMKEAHGELVRPGIMLYGSHPVLQQQGPTIGLQPVMTLQSEVIALHELNAGETVGYGQAYKVDKSTLIAVVAIGYGDGYPRSAKNGTPVLIKGKTFPMAGRVSMDMITVDVTNGDVALGDTVTLWGTGLSADVVAEHCDTISYELFCQITERVKKQYIGREVIN